MRRWGMVWTKGKSCVALGVRTYQEIFINMTVCHDSEFEDGLKFLTWNFWISALLTCLANKTHLGLYMYWDNFETNVVYVEKPNASMSTYEIVTVDLLCSIW